MHVSADIRPLVLGIGGGATPGSSTEQALAVALHAVEATGARTLLFGGEALARLPLYLTPDCRSNPIAKALVAAVREADGMLIASPGYHGTVSGLVKNAIDYFEENARDTRPYLHDRPVGLIAVAGGWQAAASTLGTLRTIVHALRGWPTPLGAAIKSHAGLFADGGCTEAAVQSQLEAIGRQVASFSARLSAVA